MTLHPDEPAIRLKEKKTPRRKCFDGDVRIGPL